MISQTEIDRLLATFKKVLVNGIIIPQIGNKLSIDAVSIMDEKEEYIIDMNRGRIKLTQCTFQNRFMKSMVLLRLDIDGPPHINPDGENIPCPHLHIFREGYGTSWAIPFEVSDDLIQALEIFMQKCNVTNIPSIQGRIV